MNQETKCAFSRCAPGRLVMAAVAAAVGGAVAPAALADGETFEFRVSNPLSPSQPTATVSLWAIFDPADFAYQVSKLDVRASETGWSDPRSAFTAPAPQQYPGVIAGPAVEEIICGQLNLPPLPADPSNPIRVWEATFEVSEFTPRTISLETSTVEFRVYFSDSPASESRMATFTEGAGAIRVIPAPGVLAVLGAAGLLAVPRWRAR